MKNFNIKEHNMFTSAFAFVKTALEKILDPETLNKISSLKDNTGNVLDGLKKSLEGVQDTVSSTKDTLGLSKEENKEQDIPLEDTETHLESIEEENEGKDTSEEEIDDLNTNTEEK